MMGPVIAALALSAAPQGAVECDEAAKAKDARQVELFRAMETRFCWLKETEDRSTEWAWLMERIRFTESADEDTGDQAVRAYERAKRRQAEEKAMRDSRQDYPTAP